VQKAFSEVVQEQKLKVAGIRASNAGRAATRKQLSFSATFEIYPEVKLGDLAAGGRSSDPPTRWTMQTWTAPFDSCASSARAGNPSHAPRNRVTAFTVDFTGRIDGNEFPGGKGAGVAVVVPER